MERFQRVCGVDVHACRRMCLYVPGVSVPGRSALWVQLHSWTIQICHARLEREEEVRLWGSVGMWARTWLMMFALRGVVPCGEG